jgi:hypothetical protein
VEEFGEPLGIELSGTNLMVAVAAEKGHDIPAAAVPQLATAFASVQHCAIKEMASVHAVVKDGALSAPPDAKRGATSACVAQAIDGKPITSLSATKLLIQIAPAQASRLRSDGEATR